MDLELNIYTERDAYMLISIDLKRSTSFIPFLQEYLFKYH